MRKCNFFRSSPPTARRSEPGPHEISSSLLPTATMRSPPLPPWLTEDTASEEEQALRLGREMPGGALTTEGALTTGAARTTHGTGTTARAGPRTPGEARTAEAARTTEAPRTAAGARTTGGPRTPGEART